MNGFITRSGFIGHEFVTDKYLPASPESEINAKTHVPITQKIKNVLRDVCLWMILRLGAIAFHLSKD